MPKHKKVFQPQDRQKCGGKNCYTSKHEVELVKEQQELLHRDLILAIYRCVSCRSWHLTQKQHIDDGLML